MTPQKCYNCVEGTSIKNDCTVAVPGLGKERNVAITCPAPSDQSFCNYYIQPVHATTTCSQEHPPEFTFHMQDETTREYCYG